MVAEQKLLNEWHSRLIKIVQENSKLRTRAILRLVFKPRPLRIGSGIEAGPEARLTVATMKFRGKTIPIIPESSWRGVLRKIGEILAKSSTFPDELDQFLASNHVEPEEKPITHEFSEELLEKLHKDVERMKNSPIISRFIPEDVLEKERPSFDEYQPLLSSLCPICRLFGGPGFRGKLIICDTLLKGEIFDRTHVSISRLTGVREEGHLFTAEYVLPKSVNLEIIIENVIPSSGEALILSGVLNWILKLGLEIGGFRSRGAGHLTLMNEGSYVYVVNYEKLDSNQIIKGLIKPEEVGEKLTISQYISSLISQ